MPFEYNGNTDYSTKSKHTYVPYALFASLVFIFIYRRRRFIVAKLIILYRHVLFALCFDKYSEPG